MSISPLDLLVLALATLYLSFALTKSDGPFKVFEKFRARLPLGGLTSCIVCAAFWIGLLFVWIWTTPLQMVVVIFAVAGAATLAAYYTGMAQQ